MRLYSKPELWIEAFDVVDVITASITAVETPITDENENINMAGAPVIEEFVERSTVFPESTVADPSGAFQQQVTGGNIIQEGLNNLYENFLNRF